MASLDTSAYRLVFDDEFNSLNLRTADNPNGIWDTTYAWGDRTLSGNNEQEFYIDPSYKNLGISPFSIQNGVLDISAQPASASLKPQINNLDYTSGMISSAHTFSETYGYFEMRAQLPAGKGLWPAFWMLSNNPVDPNAPQEIDIMEMIGNYPNNLSTTVHGTASAGTNGIGSDINVADMTTGFHTYGMLWSPTTISFYFDGQQVWSVATPSDMHNSMYLIANLAVGGDWPGSPDSSTHFPADMKIDYIRAYATADTIPDQTPPLSTGTSGTGTGTSTGTSGTGTSGTGTSGTGTSTGTTFPSDATHPASGAPTHWISSTNPAAHVTGTNGNDQITGVEGKADVGGLAGDKGDDTYIVDNPADKVIEYAGQGIDTVLSHSSTYTLPANVENLGLTGTSAITGIGNDGANILAANDAGNTLKGMGGDDLLVGGKGNDTLDGGTGADVMKGGLGNDTYYVDNANDKVVELSNQGVDTVHATVSYTLPQFVENITLDGTLNINATGNSWNNVIVGNNGNNVLSGGAGDDRLFGAKGNDTLIGGDGNDVFVLKMAGAGTDTIKDFKLGSDNLDMHNVLASVGATSSTSALQAHLIEVVQNGTSAQIIAHAPGHSAATVAMLANVDAAALVKTADHWL
jgi:beta-glucanase (GH16 family)